MIMNEPSNARFVEILLLEDEPSDAYLVKMALKEGKVLAHLHGREGLDFFKRVNDTYGHATGDAVLKAFAEIALNNSRAIDVTARLGGEEFAILLAGADKHDALAMAERLREQVAAIVIDHEAGPVRVTVSIGAAAILADDVNGDAVLHRADAALYEAKDRGRNQTYWSCF